jgi:drug/metabolite transporter (DMT)-like permease
VIGVVLSLFSALAFSLSDVAVRRGVVKTPPSHGAFITVLMGVPLFAIACIVTGQILHAGDLPLGSYGLLGAAGVIHYVVGRFCNYAAIGAIGAARAGPIQALNLPYSVIVAFIFLDEDLTLGMAAGIALILVGPLIMIERQAGVREAVTMPAGGEPVAPVKGQEFQLRQVEGYFFATLAAVGYGTSPVLIRAALEGESGVSLLGGLMSYVAASIFLVATLAIPARRSMLSAFDAPTLRAFAPSGSFVFMAQMLRFVALSVASVAVVSTLLRFSNVFTLVVSWLVNRRLEMITPRTVLGVVFSLVGAVVLIAA